MRDSAPPPPLRGIVIDGSNVVASGLRRASERVRMAVGWARGFRPDLPVMVLIDDSTFLRCGAEQNETLTAMCRESTDALRVRRCPLRTQADPALLEHAREGALLVTNDRFWDHEPLRRAVLTVQFALRGDEFRVYDEATWFDADGGARRIPLAALR